MALPSAKAPSITAFLDGLTNRTEAIRGNRCVDAPTGCGKVAENFDGIWSAKEYTISGLCQACQDSVFGSGEEG